MIFQNYLRLTDNIPNKKGYIWNRHPVDTPFWEVELSFQISGSSGIGGDGIAFWYTKDRSQEGPVFGSRNNWIGLGVFIDTYDNNNNGDNPRISIAANDGSIAYDPESDGQNIELAGCSADFRRTSKPSGLLVRYNHETKLLEVEYNVNSGPWKKCADVSVDLPRGYNFGVSAATGGVSDTHDVFRFITRKLSAEDPTKPNAPSQTQPTQQTQQQEQQQQQQPQNPTAEDAAKAEIERLRKEVEDMKKQQQQPAEQPQQPATEDPKNAELEKLRKELEDMKKAQNPPPAEPPKDPKDAELEKLRKELEDMKKAQNPPPAEPPKDPKDAELEKLRKELEDMKKAQAPPPPPVEPPKPAEQPQKPAEPAQPQPTEQKPVVDAALEERLAALEVRVKQSNERLSAVAESMMKLANIGETVEELSRNMASGNAPQTNDDTVRQELDDQLAKVRKALEESQSISLRALQTRLDSLKERVTTLSTAFSNTQAMLSQSGGNGLLIVFVIVQIVFAAVMFYLNKRKNDVKKLF